MPVEELVRDVMSRDVVTVSRRTPVRDFLELAERAGISGAPVVDAEDRVVGVVSVTDVLRAVGGTIPGGRLGARPGAIAAASVPDTVGEIMTRATVSVDGGSGLSAAAAFLVRADVHRALVFEEGRLTGIVTTNDLLAALLRASDRSDAPDPDVGAS